MPINPGGLPGGLGWRGRGVSGLRRAPNSSGSFFAFVTWASVDCVLPAAPGVLCSLGGSPTSFSVSFMTISSFSKAHSEPGCSAPRHCPALSCHLPSLGLLLWPPDWPPHLLSPQCCTQNDCLKTGGSAYSPAQTGLVQGQSQSPHMVLKVLQSMQACVSSGIFCF